MPPLYAGMRAHIHMRTLFHYIVMALSSDAVGDVVAAAAILIDVAAAVVVLAVAAAAAVYNAGHSGRDRRDI